MAKVPALNKSLIAWTAVSAVLAGIFMLYLQSEFLTVLAEQVWACF
jgi:uncharacterized membrane protein (DUF441 family)